MTVRQPDKQWVIGSTPRADIDIVDIPQEGISLEFHGSFFSDWGAGDTMVVEINGDTDAAHYEYSSVRSGFGGEAAPPTGTKNFVPVPGTGSIRAVYSFWIDFFTMNVRHALVAVGDVGDTKGNCNVGWQCSRYHVAAPVERVRLFLLHGRFINTRLGVWRP